jgi:hypothetical protein
MKTEMLETLLDMSKKFAARAASSWLAAAASEAPASSTGRASWLKGRFMGLALLVPGVVSPDLPRAFAASAAVGDIVAATLAMLSLLFLRSGTGVLLVWIFNVWGSVDLVNAFYQAYATGLSAGQLGATYFIPTLIVPLLLITHGLMFRVLLQPRKASVMRESRQPA